MPKNLTNGVSSNGASTESYAWAPYAKTSWNPSTLTRQELRLLQELSDPVLQSALPYGLATPNRTGGQAQLTVGAFKGNLIEAKGLFTSLSEVDPVTAEAAKATFTEFGGGAKVDVLGLAGFAENPLELSGSFKRTQREQGEGTFTADFINAGLYYKFFRRFGLTAGFQQIKGEGMQNLTTGLDLGLTIVPVLRTKQTQWMAGIDYTINRHAWLTVAYGMILTENTYALQGVYDAENQKWAASTNLPNYLYSNLQAASEGEDGSVTVPNETTHKFTRNILEATINVEF
jgi:hypothetical protein